MKPPARFQAAIEIIELCHTQDIPAKAIVAEYLRKRRYIGSKDRRNIGDTVFAIIRDRYYIEWQLSQIGAKACARALAFGHLIKINKSLTGLMSLFDGAPYSPSALTQAENTWIPRYLKACNQQPSDMPCWVRGNYPPWLQGELVKSFGKELIPEMRALNAEAPMDVRVNTTKSNRASLLKALERNGLNAMPTKYARNGIHIFDRPALRTTKEYREGFMEIQDEGSQIIASLVAAESGHCVIDFCAGAGGKSLALAENCLPNGRIISCDTSADRLSKMNPRLTRAGIKNVEARQLKSGTNWLDSAKQSAHRVLVDVPCSGTGTWRRTPDARTGLTPEKLSAYQQNQSQILDTASALVKPGGRLIYATCSVLESENMGQVQDFLHRQRMFKLIPIGPIWLEKIGSLDVPVTDTLQLTPRQHGVDGFFIAVFERI